MIYKQNTKERMKSMSRKRILYESAEIEVVSLLDKDVITTSGDVDPFDKVITDDEYWD